MRPLINASDFEYHLQKYRESEHRVLFHRNMTVTYVYNFFHVLLSTKFKKNTISMNGDKNDLQQSIILKYLEFVESGEIYKIEYPLQYSRAMVSNALQDYFREKQKQKEKFGKFEELCAEHVVPPDVLELLDEEHLRFVFLRWRRYKPKIYFQPTKETAPIINTIVSALKKLRKEKPHYLHIPVEEAKEIGRRFRISSSRMQFYTRFYIEDIKHYLKGIYS